jgi:hypothetical protein
MTVTTDHADMIGFTLTHALFRNELPRLVAAFSGPVHPAADAAVIEDHLRLVTDHLIRHHQEEDEFHWPLLAARAPGVGRLLALLEREHVQMDPLIDDVRETTSAQSDRAAALTTLTELVLKHLAEEDRSIVPLLAVHITAEEQFGSMMRSRAKIPPSDELRVLAMMLDAADAAERTRMLAPLPQEVVELWQQAAAPELESAHRVLAQASR